MPSSQANFRRQQARPWRAPAAQNRHTCRHSPDGRFPPAFSGRGGPAGARRAAAATSAQLRGAGDVEAPGDTSGSILKMRRQKICEITGQAVIVDVKESRDSRVLYRVYICTIFLWAKVGTFAIVENAHFARRPRLRRHPLPSQFCSKIQLDRAK